MSKIQKSLGMLLIAVLILAGCSTGKDNGSTGEQPTDKPAARSDGPVEITIYGSWSTEQEKGKALKTDRKSVV